MSFTKLILRGVRDRCTFLFPCFSCLAMSISAGCYDIGSTFWWVFVLELGDQPLQFLIRSFVKYVVGYLSQCKWLFWIVWMQYCLQVNEPLSPLCYYAFQFIFPFSALYLLCDDNIQWFAGFCLGFGELVVCAVGSVVGSRVALVVSEQPWLIAPSCTAQIFPRSIMRPCLAETQIAVLQSVVQSLATLKLPTMIQNSLHGLLLHCSLSLYCVFMFELRSFKYIVRFQVALVDPSVRPWLLHLWQPRSVRVLANPRMQSPVACIHTPPTFVSRLSCFPFYSAIASMLLGRLHVLSIVCIKFYHCSMEKTSIMFPSLYSALISLYGERNYKVLLPYDSKACVQHAFGLRLISAMWAVWSNRTLCETVQGCITKFMSRNANH